MHITRGLLSIAALLATGLTATAAPAPGEDVLREGTGDRRAALDKMELAPFDQSLWGGLTEWANGDPVTAEDTAGKVVVIYTWAGYLRTAVRPMSIVNRLAQQHPDDLLVVGVHDDAGWEDGQLEAERRRASFPIARDGGNAMRAALKVDQDPDFYVIDRSGRVRFADIDTGSLERAVTLLVEESTDDAETLLTRMAEADVAAAEKARRTARLRSQIDLSDLPWVSFPQPSKEAYDSAGWPEKKEEEDTRRRSRRSAPSGPTSINPEGGEEWSPSKPQPVQGRATLVYLFTPDIVTTATRGGFSAVELFQMMDQLQTAHARDLQVIGVMVNNTDDRRSRRRRGNDDSAAEAARKAKERFDELMRDLPVNHPRVYDPSGSFITSRITPDNGDGRSNSRNAVYFIPYHVLASSDGTVRWHGAIGVSTERYAEWEAALDTVLRVDPGIEARRQAEEEYIRSLTE